jgi:molybdenum cofactor biosynthesis enzyme MoaA
MEKKARLKTIGYEELEFVMEWTCPYCKEFNTERGDYDGEEILTCIFCNKDTKVKEPPLSFNS